MKELFINNRMVLMGEDTYFPFTYTISDLENVNTINLPASKAITIPRCPTNDEIFGHIGNLTRINIGTLDGQSGILFNQIKKCEYILAYNSEVISKGLVYVDNITEKNYEITLYDELLKKLEDLEGNKDTGEYLLSSCPILDEYSDPYTFTSRASVVGALTNSSPVCPVVCIKDSVLDDGEILCYESTNGVLAATPSLVELPTECTSIQLRSHKNWELNYTYPINKMIESINYQYPDSISYDESLEDMFAEVNLLTNPPTNNYVSDSHNIKYSTITSSTGTFVLNDNVTPYGNLVTRNGHYSFNLFMTFDFKSASPSTTIASHYYNGVLVESFNTSTPDGTQIGKVWIKNNLQISTTHFGQPTWKEVALLYNVNTFVILNGSNAEYLDIVVNIPHEADFYPQILYAGTTTLDADIYLTNPSDSKEVYTLLNGGVLNQRILSATSTVTYNSIDFKTGELIDGSKIFPKIGIKDFVIQLAKFFNLDVIIKDSILHLQPKKYYKTSDILYISELTDIAINNVTFDQMQLINTLPQADALDKYKSRYKQTYATQVINTGYSIRKNVKDITMDVGIPILLDDYNIFAYDKFTRYFNGGYSRVNHGVINGYKDQLVFGYLNPVNDFTYITDDISIEAGMPSTATEIKFTHYNPFLISNTALDINNANKFYWYDYSITGGIKKTSYFTFSPYKFAGNNISRSLEINKPKINYAKITDAQYNSNTTLYYNFHRNLIIDKYSSDTHILSVKVYIDKPIDIYKIYNYNNSFYIISEITEYDPTEPGVYEIKLMRVNDPNNYINNIIL